MQSEDLAAVLLSEAWMNAPLETDPQYFRTWQRVSVALQQGLRRWIPELYFRDLKRLEDRETGYQFIVYAACRPCYGRPKTEFTFDTADPSALPAALRTIGRAMRTVLEPVQKRLTDAGMPALGRRYAAVWHKDILLAVEQHPKRLIGLIAAETRLIDAVIDLGTTNDLRKFERAAGAALRNIAGVDMRELILPALTEAAEIRSREKSAATA
jgi:hypothetical protein